MSFRTHFLMVFDGMPVAASASFSVTQRASLRIGRGCSSVSSERLADGRGGPERCEDDARIASVSHRVVASMWMDILSPHAARL